MNNQLHPLFHLVEEKKLKTNIDIVLIIIIIAVGCVNTIPIGQFVEALLNVYMRSQYYIGKWRCFAGLAEDNVEQRQIDEEHAP